MLNNSFTREQLIFIQKKELAGNICHYESSDIPVTHFYDSYPYWIMSDDPYCSFAEEFWLKMKKENVVKTTLIACVGAIQEIARFPETSVIYKNDGRSALSGLVRFYNDLAIITQPFIPDRSGGIYGMNVTRELDENIKNFKSKGIDVYASLVRKVRIPLNIEFE